MSSTQCRHCCQPLGRHDRQYSETIDGHEIVACSDRCLSAAVKSWKEYRASVAHLPDPRPVPRRERLLALLRRAVTSC